MSRLAPVEAVPLMPPSSPTACPSFAVVIPAFNEGAGAAECVRQVSAALECLENPTEVIAVDDGSVDDTGVHLASMAERVPNLRIVSHPANRGYGAALRSGVDAAAAAGLEYVVFMDSDLTNDPRYLAEFARHMSEGTDVIKASRYVAGGGFEGVPWWREALSVAGNTVARLLMQVPLRDCTNGFRAVKTDLLTRIELREDGFELIMEELYKLKPLARTYAEVPIILTTRSQDRRPSVFSYTPRTLSRYLKYPTMSAARALLPRS